MEDKLANWSLSSYFLDNGALIESASGAIAYHGRNWISWSREIDSGGVSGLASGVEVEIKLCGSGGGGLYTTATELCGSTEGQPPVTRLSFYFD